MLRTILLVLGFCLTGFALPVAGQTTAAASQPTTRPRYVVVIPPGFHTITVNQRTLIVEPADEAWVKATVEGLTPTTLPTTMPSDLLGQLSANHQQLVDRMTKDLALADHGIAEKFLTENLEKTIRNFHEINPPLFYIVATPARLVELIKAGWTDKRFRYNRMANTVDPDTVLDLTPDGRADDVLLPALYNAGVSPSARQQSMTDAIQNSESQLAKSISSRSMLECLDRLMRFALEQTEPPAQKKLELQWFPVGLSASLATRYAATITGMTTESLVRILTLEDPRLPLRQSAIDLIHPPDPNDMRPQLRPMFLAVFQGKSTRVVNSWLNRAGIDAVPKVLAEFRKNPPADGAALLGQIKQISGIDLAADVAAGN